LNLSEMMLLNLSLMVVQIHDIIREKGYTGTQDAIRGFISKERRIQRDLLASCAGSEEFIDKKWLIRLLYKPIDELKGISEAQLKFVLKNYPEYNKIIDAVWGFRDILKSKEPEMLPEWIDRVSSFGIAELDSFIGGLRLDMDAVMNAIIYDYSNGLAEGTVNKIKVIKRIMYGRCRFDLLKNKCILLDFFR